MVLIRSVALLLMAALLSGMHCAPVHSDRPLGSQAYEGMTGGDARSASDLNGLWILDIPAGAHVAPGYAPRRYIAWFQPELDRFVVLPSALGSDKDKGTVGELILRTHRVAGEQWFFFNEEDRRLKGAFLWALARRVNVDTFLIWPTDPGRGNFQAFVERGQLPGTVVQDLKGKSLGDLGDIASAGLSANGLPVVHSVLLQGLEPRHLDLIVEHRAEVFLMDAPLVLLRIDTFPALRHPDVRAIRTPPDPAASAVAP